MACDVINSTWTIRALYGGLASGNIIVCRGKWQVTAVYLHVSIAIEVMWFTSWLMITASCVCLGMRKSPPLCMKYLLYVAAT